VRREAEHFVEPNRFGGVGDEELELRVDDLRREGGKIRRTERGQPAPPTNPLTIPCAMWHDGGMTSIQSQLAGVIATALLAAGSAFAQPVDDICTALGDARHYGIVARGSFKAKSFPVRDYSEIIWYGATIENVCAVKGQVQSTSNDGDTIMTSARGGAFAIKKTHEDAVWSYTNRIVTGGGTVSGLQYLDDFFYGVDATGQNQLVRSCGDAQAAIRAASQDFAGRSPTHSFGSITVRPGENYVMDLRGFQNPVVNLDALVLAPTSSPYRLPYCDNYPGPENASLEILTDPGDHEIILNVAGTLRLGNCAWLDWFGTGLHPIVFNAVGSGGKVSIGKGDHWPAFFLAPERSIDHRGLDGNRDARVGGLFGKNVSLSGDTDITPSCNDEFNDVFAECGDGIVMPNNDEWCDGDDDEGCVAGPCTENCVCGEAPNPDCETATMVTSFPFADVQPSSAFGDNYYRFTAPKSGTLTVHNRNGAMCPARLCLRAGDCTASTPLGCESPDSLAAYSELVRPVVAGQEYIVIGGDYACNRSGITLTLK